MFLYCINITHHITAQHIALLNCTDLSFLSHFAVHKAGVDFLALQGPPPTMAAMQILSDSVPAVLPDTSEVRPNLI